MILNCPYTGKRPRSVLYTGREKLGGVVVDEDTEEGGTRAVAAGEDTPEPGATVALLG